MHNVAFHLQLQKGTDGVDWKIYTHMYIRTPTAYVQHVRSIHPAHRKTFT